MEKVLTTEEREMRLYEVLDNEYYWFCHQVEHAFDRKKISDIYSSYYSKLSKMLDCIEFTYSELKILSDDEHKRLSYMVKVYIDTLTKYKKELLG